MTRLRLRPSPGLLAFSAALLAGPAPTVAQAVDGEPVVIGHRLTLHSQVLEEDREILVHLPQGYETSTDRHAVLYVLDGPAHFHHVSGAVQSLAVTGRIPPTIVVGIANTDRQRDFYAQFELASLLEQGSSSLFTRDGALQRAIQIFRRNVALYPESANVYDSLADGLEEAGELAEALRSRDEAVRRAEEVGDRRLETFRRKRDALRERVAEQAPSPDGAGDAA